MDDTELILALALGFATPILAATTGFATWWFRSRIEELRTLEEQLTEDRRRIYRDILVPYIQLFAAAGDLKNRERVSRQMHSLDYRKTAFELSLIASDDVVNAYNRMMQYFYNLEPGHVDLQSSQEGIRLFGALLLSIRRSLGNRDTDLSEWDMLRWLVRDIDSVAPSAQ